MPRQAATDLPESVYTAARKSLMEASGYQSDDPHYGIDSPWWKKLADAAVDAAVAELGLVFERKVFVGCTGSVVVGKRQRVVGQWRTVQEDSDV